MGFNDFFFQYPGLKGCLTQWLDSDRGVKYIGTLGEARLAAKGYWSHAKHCNIVLRRMARRWHCLSNNGPVWTSSNQEILIIKYCYGKRKWRRNLIGNLFSCEIVAIWLSYYNHIFTRLHVQGLVLLKGHFLNRAFGQKVRWHMRGGKVYIGRAQWMNGSNTGPSPRNLGFVSHVKPKVSTYLLFLELVELFWVLRMHGAAECTVCTQTLAE